MESNKKTSACGRAGHHCYTRFCSTIQKDCAVQSDCSKMSPDIVQIGCGMLSNFCSNAFDKNALKLLDFVLFSCMDVYNIQLV